MPYNSLPRKQKGFKQKVEHRPCPNCYQPTLQIQKGVRDWECPRCGVLRECGTCKNLVNRHGRCLCGFAPKPSRKKKIIKRPNGAAQNGRKRLARQVNGTCCICDQPLAAAGYFCKEHGKWRLRYSYWTKRRKEGVISHEDALKLMREMSDREQKHHNKVQAK